MSAAIAITGASSFAAWPLLHALLRREPRQVVLCDPLDGLAELRAQLLPWCEQQGISTSCSGGARKRPPSCQIFAASSG